MEGLAIPDVAVLLVQVGDVVLGRDLVPEVEAADQDQDPDHAPEGIAVAAEAGPLAGHTESAVNTQGLAPEAIAEVKKKK